MPALQDLRKPMTCKRQLEMSCKRCADHTALSAIPGEEIVDPALLVAPDDGGERG
jgi:hypothetical protein